MADYSRDTAKLVIGWRTPPLSAIITNEEGLLEVSNTLLEANSKELDGKGSLHNLLDSKQVYSVGT